MDNNEFINFGELYKTDFDLTDLYIMRQKWTKGVLFRKSVPRKTSGLIFLNKCTGIYTDKNGNSFEAPPKSVVFLPQGSEYTCLNAECSETFDDAILAEFNIVSKGKILTLSDAPFRVCDINEILAREDFYSALKSYEASVRSPMEVKSAIIALLINICKEKITKDYKRFSVIKNGIELIEASPLMDISIEEIAKSCNISACYFRRFLRNIPLKLQTNTE